MIAVLALLLASSPGGAECAALEAAHQALLESAFTVERHFSVTLNGKLKRRQVTRLVHRDRTLAKEELSREVLDSKVVLEEDDSEAIVDLPFSCDRLDLAGGTVALTSPDGAETVVYELDPEAGALRPLRWINRESTRLLFKKLEIEAVARYENFAWIAEDNEE